MCSFNLEGWGRKQGIRHWFQGKQCYGYYCNLAKNLPDYSDRWNQTVCQPNNLEENLPDYQNSVKTDYSLGLSRKLNASMDGTFQRASSRVYFPANLREGTLFFSGYARR